MVATREKHAVEALGGGAGAIRLAKVIAKTQEREESPLASARLHLGQNMIHNNHGQSTFRLMAENSRKLYFLALEDIDYIEACGNYVLIHIGDQKYVRRDTITRLALELRDVNFEWIKRSMLINLSRVAFAEKLEHGAFAFTLSSGTRLVSKNRVRLACARIKHSDR